MISDGRIGCGDQLHRQRAGFLRRAQPVGVHRRDRAVAQRHHAQRLGDAGHGGGGAHHAAGAGGGGQPALDLADPFGGDAAGAIRRPVAAAVGAGGQPLALVRRRQHRAGDQLHRRDVGRGGGHQLRRHRLVAAADQHRGIHRLRGQHRLGVERGEVAVVHRGREQRRLAQRHGGERQRQPAGRQHAALHRLDQFGDRAVAVVEARAGIDDADHRAIQHRLRIAHRLGERPAQVQREVAIAVVGGVAGQAAFRCGFFVHAGMLSVPVMAGARPRHIRRGTVPQLMAGTIPV